MQAPATSVFNTPTTLACFKKMETLENVGMPCAILYPLAIDGDLDRGVRAVVDAFPQ